MAKMKRARKSLEVSKNMEMPNVPKLMRFHSFYEARSPEWNAENNGTLAWQF